MGVVLGVLILAQIFGWSAADLLGGFRRIPSEDGGENTAFVEAEVNALVEEMNSDDIGVRLKAVATLKEIGRHSEKAVLVLGEALKDENVNVRRDAAMALAAVGSKAAPAIPALIGALDDDDSFVRINSIFALSMIGDEALVAYDELCDVAVNDVSPAVRSKAEDLLIKLGRIQNSQ